MSHGKTKHGFTLLSASKIAFGLRDSFRFMKMTATKTGVFFKLIFEVEVSQPNKTMIDIGLGSTLSTFQLNRLKGFVLRLLPTTFTFALRTTSTLGGVEYQDASSCGHPCHNYNCKSVFSSFSLTTRIPFDIVIILAVR